MLMLIILTHTILAANGSVTPVDDIKTKDTTSTVTTTTETTNKAFICTASFSFGGSIVNATGFATLEVAKGTSPKQTVECYPCHCPPHWSGVYLNSQDVKVVVSYRGPPFQIQTNAD